MLTPNPGDIVVLTRVGRVLDVTDGKVTATDLVTNDRFEPPSDGDVKYAEAHSSVQTAPRSVVVAAMLEAGRRPFKVRFFKADGHERYMRCRLISHDSLFGRSVVEDLDLPPDNNIRQIDHRTLDELTLDGVRYFVGG